MAYNSKYTGEQVEAQLDKVDGKADKTYVDAEVAAAKEYASGELSAVREDLEAADQDLKLYVDEQTLASKDYTDFKTKDKYVKPSSGIPASDLAPDVFLQGEKGDKGDKGDTGATGPQGPQGVSVSSVAQTTTSTADGGTNVVTVTLSNGTKSTFNVKNGSKGSNGTNGTNGATFTPSVDSAGNLSWTNNGGLSNPPTVNIKGPKGDKGDSGSGGGSSSGGAYAQVNHGTADTTFTLTPNTFHVWDEVASLTLTLGSETAGVANEYVFQFTSGSTATSLTLPDDIKWANDSAPTIAENKIYQVSILKGLASVLEFSNAIVFPEIGSTNGLDNEEYAKVYEYFVNTYNLTSTSASPSNGVAITETLICNSPYFGGSVLKVSLNGTRLLLWTQKAIDTLTVPSITNLGRYLDYTLD